MGTEALTVGKACQLLSLDAPTTAEHLTAAFRRAAKAAHPDTVGGNVVLFRQIIDAYHLLQQHSAPAPQYAVPARRPRPANTLPPLLVVTPMQALYGGTVGMTIEGRKLLIHTPPGIRTGDHIRLDQVGQVPVLIRPADNMSVLGGDLFVTAPVAHRYLRDGGRLEIQTPCGPQTAWLVPDMHEPVRLCFKGLGLPARGKRPAGNLFVKLEGSDDLPSAVEDMIDQFTRLWTGDAVAA